ncbi:AAA family ATPase [Candidatus Saccharibacteria bacterium]|nr:AAA family ATPase [Candidatus Saccharibacteria bacterium]
MSENHNAEKTSSGTLEATIIDAVKPYILEVIDRYIETQNMCVRRIEIVSDERVVRRVDGVFHKSFQDIVKLVNSGIPTMLVGPAGSGKNVCVKQVAEALDLEMYYTNNVSNEFKITGFIDAGGVYRETEFYRAFKNGGVFFLDEIDASDPSALIILNSAISNGYFTFPHERIERHPDFRCVAAANTWGDGRSFQYVGRNALDAASVDRFVSVLFEYDEALEGTLFPDDELLSFVWAARDAAIANDLRHIFSMRKIKYAYEMRQAGFEYAKIVQYVLLAGMEEDDVVMLLNNITSVRQNNKYLVEARSLYKGGDKK